MGGVGWGGGERDWEVADEGRGADGRIHEGMKSIESL